MNPVSEVQLSIIVATWNAAATLDRCIQSISAQTCTDLELIVIDGGSTDGTVAIIESRARHITYWHSRPDAGIYDAWNQALRQARGQYICFLGADDALHSPDAIRSIFDSVGAASPELITCRGMVRKSSGLTRAIIGDSWANSRLPRHFRLCHPGLLHHRSLFDTYGQFDARYKIAGDLEFLLRLPENIDCMDVPLVAVDVQDGGVSQHLFWKRINERRRIHSLSPRIGPFKAWVYWLDKAWRRPIAVLLGLPH